MAEYCKIYCSGSVKAPYDWITSVPIGINRFVLINDGIGGYIENNKQIPFEKNWLYLFPENTHFIPTYSSYESNEKRLDHSYVNFELVPPILSKKVFRLNYENDNEIKYAIETFKAICVKSTLQKKFENLTESNQKFLKNIVIFLVEKIIEKYNLEIVHDETIIKALKIMHENLNKQQRISDIAKACFLSSDGFIRKFKNLMGETPYSYLKKIKIRTAQNMRALGSNLSEIAEKCGYSDSSSLLHAITRSNSKL